MAAYRDTTSSIFHWVTQYQLLPVWQEYPPPFTAYESQILEKDREKYYPVFCSAQAPDFETHRISSSPEGPITNSYDSIKSSELFSNFSIFDSTPSFSFSHHEIPKTPKIRLYPAPYNQPNSRPSLPLSAPESQESSDFSQEDNRDEDSEDVENSEEEPEIYGGKRRGYDLSNLNEVVQPRKRQRTTPEQLEVLEKVYETEKLPNSDLRKELAVKLKMTPRRVQVWFQNKRAKEKRMTYPK